MKSKKGYKLVKWLFGKKIEIPEGWDWEQILDNSTLKGRIGWQGLTTAEYLQQGKFYLVTGTDFRKGRIDWKNCVYVDEDRYSQDVNIQLKNKDVLITKDGTIGKIAYVNLIPLPSTLNTGVFVVRPVDKKYIPLFFYYILYSDYFIKFLNKLKAGSTINHLYQRDFNTFYFPIPTIPEQQKIASILSNVDALIEFTQQIVDKTEMLKKGLIQELLTRGIRHDKFKKIPWLFGKEIEIPEEWKVKKIKKIAKVKGGKRLPKGVKFADNKTKYPYIRVSDFNNGTVDFQNIKYITSEINKKIKRYTISSQDVFISIAGTIGLAGLIPDVLDGANLTENSAKIYNLKTIKKEFLSIILNSYIVQKQIYSYLGKTSQPKLALFRIEKLLILIPAINEQQKIASILSGIDAYIQKNQEYKKKLEKLKKGLMQNLLTGKIRVKI